MSTHDQLREAMINRLTENQSGGSTSPNTPPPVPIHDQPVEESTEVPSESKIFEGMDLTELLTSQLKDRVPTTGMSPRVSDEVRETAIKNSQIDLIRTLNL